jgi:predicted ferric reductase
MVEDVTITVPTADHTATPKRRVPKWYPDAGASAAGVSLLIVAALWLSNRGWQLLSTDPLDSTGRLTGLFAADLLLLQVLLMARIPLAERAFGQDRLARWHRWTGFTSFWLMVAHIVLITLGYAAAEHANAFAELWDMIWTYPGMLLATAGTLALIMVVVTSVRVARRRLRYESWHLLHLYAYLGVGLALPHQLWTGSDFLASPAATAYWWTLYGAAAAAVLAYRIGLPAWRNLRHRLVVDRVVPEGPGLTSVYLRGNHVDRLPVRAGQFFQWRFLGGPGWTRSHPYSLSATPHGHLLRITVKDLGDGSSRVAGLRPGTRVLIEGPYGALTADSYAGGPVVMLACGIGVTPLLSLLGDLPYAPGQATLVYRARSEAEIAFRDELEWFATQRGVHLVYLLGGRAERSSWLPAQYADHSDADALRQIAPQIAHANVYVCGPEPWTAAAREAAHSAGVAPEHLHTEQFAW